MTQKVLFRNVAVFSLPCHDEPPCHFFIVFLMPIYYHSDDDNDIFNPFCTFAILYFY